MCLFIIRQLGAKFGAGYHDGSYIFLIFTFSKFPPMCVASSHLLSHPLIIFEQKPSAETACDRFKQ
jgi:hypothetical protein